MGKSTIVIPVMTAVVLLASVAPSAAAPAASAGINEKPTASATDPNVVRWTDEFGAAHETRALSRQEIIDRGMDKNLDMAKQRSTPPTIIRKSDTAAEAPRPTKRTNGDDVGFAGCWQDIGTYGNDDLWGTYQVDWCGDGSWITYNTQSCWGGEDNTPTYQYLGCSVSPRYGVGWNVLDVRHEFDLCYVYNPLWGTCLAHHRPWNWYRYGANGSVTWIAS
ncbi:hypothetical protein J2S43_007419 [Catenuloplanes nepalensis]|uniref:Secreted protein n=1 Tax=Catenuloplanes nepalensis TaxID=587533 RepID=A0ABT9N5D2_9ACTN|nr:hypothetical protein [Catenuloplanes nepalensis]MDP9798907.1 hypothetical protein [Catenuloplanes nepalensis]